MFIVKRFILMLQFLTTIPLPVNLNVSNEDFGKGLIFSLPVGLLLGGILTGCYYLISMVFPVNITAVLIIIIYIILTGGLHLDGLGDTFDGLFSNRPKERILEIMRDSRVGTNAVLAIISVLLVDAALLSEVDFLKYGTLLLMPVAGRMGLIISAGVSVYARRGEGLGKSFVDCCGTKEIIIGLVMYLIILFCAGRIAGILAGMVCILFSFLTVKFFSRKIDGITGDILGAVCELTQMFFLCIMFLIQKCM